MTDLFSPESADLSRMMSEQGVAVSDVVHQAYIDVTETGTEAAAVTLLNLNRNGPSRTFKANRPFLFFITDTVTKTVLFSGRVVRPQRSTRRPWLLWHEQNEVVAYFFVLSFKYQLKHIPN